MNDRGTPEYCTRCGRSMLADQAECPRCRTAFSGQPHSPDNSAPGNDGRTIRRGSLRDMLAAEPSIAAPPPAVTETPSTTPPAVPSISMPASDIASRLPSSVPSYGRRVGAYLIDAVPPILLAWVLFLVIAARSTPTEEVGYSASPNPSLDLVLWLLVALVVGAYFVFYNGRGGTIGKRLLGLKVVDVGTGTPIGPGRALLRYVVWVIPNCCCIPLSALSPVFDSSKRLRGWHDMAARSIVIPADKLRLAEAVKPYDV